MFVLLAAAAECCFAAAGAYERLCTNPAWKAAESCGRLVDFYWVVDGIGDMALDSPDAYQLPLDEADVTP